MPEIALGQDWFVWGLILLFGYPLSAIVFDYFVNGSVLGPWQWAGAAALILAIFRVSVTPQAPQTLESPA